MPEEGVPDSGAKNGQSNVRGVPAASYTRTTGVTVAQRYAERYIGVTPSFLHGVLQKKVFSKTFFVVNHGEYL